MIETVAYYVALSTLVAFPAALSIWFLVHPLAALWRRLGPAVTYVSVSPVIFLVGYVLYRSRGALLAVRFGISAPLVVISILFFTCGVYVGVLRMRHLKSSVMLGLPEVSRSSGVRLITGGIYSRVRHPRYIELGLMLAGIAFLVNYLAIYVMLVAYVPTIYLIVLLEERELRGRFGAEYEMYCREVPRFLPGPRRRGDLRK